MILMAEIAKPFRWRGRIERYGFMTRLIWGWFSVAYFNGIGLNDLRHVFSEEVGYDS